MWWLLEPSTRKRMEAAIAAGFTPSASQIEAFNGRLKAADGSRILARAGSSAEIRVEGVLTRQPDIMAWLFGGGNTTYDEVISALLEAEKDDQVEDITMVFHTPGGEFLGLFDLIAAMQRTTKFITGRIDSMAASAGYALAANTGRLVAASPAAWLGSVGVVATFMVSDDIVEVTSSEAPKKRPDVRTDEGRAIVREELDSLHQLFVESIAAGRNTTVEKVNAEFGQGGMLLADEALKRGMIDSVESKVNNAGIKATAKPGGIKTEVRPMDLQTLKAEHPAVYAAAVEEGQKQERDRVSAHLEMGEASGDMATAVKAVNDGSGMTQKLQAQYLAAGMRKAQIDSRKADDPQVDPEVDDADAKDKKASSALLANLRAALNLKGVEA